MSESVLLYISYTPIGATTVILPHDAGAVLHTCATEGDTLLLGRRHWRVEGTAFVVVLVLICALVVSEALSPGDTGVHKLTGPVQEHAQSWSRCDTHWNRYGYGAVRWRGVDITTSSAVVLSCTLVHPLFAW